MSRQRRNFKIGPALILNQNGSFPMKRVIFRIGLPLWALITIWAEPALATQGHGHPEGLYAHQMAHVFFMFSMLLLIYWLRQRRLVTQAGWRYIQYSSLFFILWNVDAFAVHFIEEQLELLQISQIDRWEIHLQAPAPYGWLPAAYYAAKLDHLLCVPALFFLYLGLKRLLHQGTGNAREARS
jgi:hypothetical protein